MSNYSEHHGLPPRISLDALIAEFSYLISDQPIFDLADQSFQTQALLHVCLEELVCHPQALDHLVYLNSQSYLSFKAALMSAWMSVCVGQAQGYESDRVFTLFVVTLMKDVYSTLVRRGMALDLNTRRCLDEQSAKFSNVILLTSFAEEVFPTLPKLPSLLSETYVIDGLPDTHICSEDSALAIALNNLANSLVTIDSEKAILCAFQAQNIHDVEKASGASARVYNTFRESCVGAFNIAQWNMSGRNLRFMLLALRELWIALERYNHYIEGKERRDKWHSVKVLINKLGLCERLQSICDFMSDKHIKDLIELGRSKKYLLELAELLPQLYYVRDRLAAMMQTRQADLGICNTVIGKSVQANLSRTGADRTENQRDNIYYNNIHHNKIVKAVREFDSFFEINVF